MIKSLDDPEYLKDCDKQDALIMCILNPETFYDARLVAIQLEAERLGKPFIALVWYKLEIPDTFLPNVIIIRIGDKSFEELRKEIENALSLFIMQRTAGQGTSEKAP